MNTEFTYLLSLLEKGYPGLREPRVVFRVIYSRALNKYEDQYKLPTIVKHDSGDFQDAKTMEKHAAAVRESCTLVILFRCSTPVYLYWYPKRLRQIEQSMPPLGQWIASIAHLHRDKHWNLDMEHLRKDARDFLLTEHRSIRNVPFRTTALDKLRRVMVLCQELDDETLKQDSMTILKFLYDCKTLCGFKIPPQLWYPLGIKEEAQIESDSERDLYVKMFRSSYDILKLEEMRKMLISCATDIWDDYGYCYPRYFSDPGKPVESRYILFMSFAESTRPVIKQSLNKIIEK